MKPYIEATLSKVSRTESNFYFPDYNAVIEMDANMLWGWEAHKDKHGTTMNSYNVMRKNGRKPKNWEDLAQWTHVSVITGSVSSATARHLVPQ